jgi:laminin beta 1
LVLFLNMVCLTVAFVCRCDTQGSVDLQCNRQTGQCHCEKGVTGEKCDRCDRGTTGTLPNCKPCGECFDNWDHIIQGLLNETKFLVSMAKDLRKNGTVGSYSNTLQDLEKKVQEIKDILEKSQVKEEDVDGMKKKLEGIRKELEAEDSQAKKMNSDLKDLKRENGKLYDKLNDAKVS